jgi:hypothetical protein
MQITRKLAKSKRGSLHFRKRLSAIFIISLLVVVVVLVLFNEFPQISLAQTGSDNNNPGSSNSPGDQNSVTGDYTYFGPQGVTPTPEPSSTPTSTSTLPPPPTFTPLVTPEFTFAGGIIAFAICFIAFGLFTASVKLRHKTVA